MRCAIAVLLCAAAAAGEPPERLIESAPLILRCNDLAWVDRAITRGCAAAGADPAEPRLRITRRLFLARDFDGIDLARPALVAWREGPAPLLAAIPIADRRRFLDNFAAVPLDDGPLARIGENAGTIVYSQNSGEGIVYYRLLVEGGYAYVARTAAECRALAARPPAMAVGAPPVTCAISGRGLRLLPGLVPDAADLLPKLVAPSTLALVRLYGRGMTPGLLDQVVSLRLQLGDEGDGLIGLRGTLTAVADSPLAQLIAVQTNAGSRLVPALRTPETWSVLYGSISWQGMLETLGRQMLPAVRAAAGAAWTTEMDEAWITAWSLRDRVGAFAHTRSGALGDERLALEQPRAEEAVRAAATLAPVLGPAVDRLNSGPQMGITSTYALAATARGPVLAGRAMLRVRDTQLPLAAWLGAGEQHLLYVEVARPRDLEMTARTMLDGMAEAVGQVATPEGDAVLLGWSMDYAALARAQWPTLTVEPAEMGLALKATPQGDLVIEGRCAYERMAQVEREVAQLRGEQRRNQEEARRGTQPKR